MSRFICFLFVTFASIANNQAAQLAPVFTDHMVLQQGMKVPIWGTGAPGESVTVKFGKEKATAKTDHDGNWLVKIPPLTASSTPQELEVVAKSGDVVIRDVLIGEVWLASGQSNMAFRLSFSEGSPESKQPDPLIRLFQVGKKTAAAPATDVLGAWKLAERENTGQFSAVAYFFAKHIRSTRDVPVGIINSSVGGTPARAWTPHHALASDPRLQGQIDYLKGKLAEFDPVAIQKKNEAAQKKYQQQIEVYKRLKADGKEPKAPREPKPSVSPALWQHSPCALYNGMIHPFTPMALAGVIWYQGEADAKAAGQYRVLFPALIKGWRQAFARELPFLFVQIAPHRDMLPEIRDAQLFTHRTVPQTAMAVITDLGHPTNIHPKKKEPVGLRLALAARAIAYGEDIIWSGPAVNNVSRSGNRLIASFDHTGTGLVAKGGELTGFEISSDGKNFAPAQAAIEGESVVLFNSGVTEPRYVRFGWAAVPDTNLFNSEGLPASPFKAEVKP